MKKVLICAGGTGGHIFPALGLGYELIRRGFQVSWAGRSQGMEREIVSSSGIKDNQSSPVIPYFPFFIRRCPIRYWSVFEGFLQGLKILNRIQPDAVVSTGSYVSAGMLFAAWLQGRRFFLLEQNRIPGKVTRFFSRFAEESFLTFPPERPFAGRYSVTGTPLREGIVGARREDDGKTVLVIGGSQGARRLNLAAVDMAAALTNLRFIILTGERDYPEIRALVRSSNCELVRWTDHPETLYARATIAVSRAGGLVISELLALGIPAILVPFPYAADEHQRANARYVADAGAAVVLEESQISGLTSLVRTLMADEARRREMEVRARAIGKVDGAQEIAERISRCLGD